MKAITFRSKKAKGNRLEAKFSSLIREKGLDDGARRMPGSGAFEGFKTDIHTTLPYSFELKNQEVVKLWAWWEQTKNQSTIAKPPVLVTSGNFKPMLATMDVNTFLELLRTIQDLEGIIEELKTHKQ